MSNNFTDSNSKIKIEITPIRIEVPTIRIEVPTIKVDLGPYSSVLYKHDLLKDEEHRLDSSKGLKFLHFNFGNQRKYTKEDLKALQNRTVAVIALSDKGVRKTASDFLALKNGEELFITMLVGVSFVSKDDNYSNKIGRDLSVKKMTEIDMKVTELNVSSTHIHVSLEQYMGVELILRTNKKTGFSTVVGKLARLP